MFTIIILPPAKKDIEEATKWYNKQQNNLGKHFTKQVREKVYFINKNP